MSATLIALSEAWKANIGIIFSWVLLLPGIATALIIVAMVSARGEKADNEKLADRWGPRPRRSEE